MRRISVIEKSCPLTELFADIDKYIVSNLLRNELSWVRSHVLRGDGVDVIRQLEEADGPDLNILGSGVLVRSLPAADLIDSYVLSIHLFKRGDGFSAQRLVRSVPTTTGVIIATYDVART